MRAEAAREVDNLEVEGLPSGSRRVWLWGAAAVLTAVLIGGAGFVAGRSAVAATTDPGSDADPLVSKSYVDQYTQMQVVSLKSGQTMTAEAGTEIVLRSGEAHAVETGGFGLSDVTGATDLRNGGRIPANHLLLVPRSDGRGVAADSDVYLMVRGVFTVKGP